MMAAKYFDVEATLNKYEASPNATRFLKAIIDCADPDAFHMFDVEKAKEWYLKDQEDGLLEF
jgi:hypothetical protein